MAVSLFTFGIEPDDLNAPVWRFLEFWRFQDLFIGAISTVAIMYLAEGTFISIALRLCGG